MQRHDILTWEEAQKVWKAVLSELSKQIETEIKAFQAAGRVSPCCLSAFRSTRNEFDRDEWPERLEKILLKQSRQKKKGKVSSRHK